MSFYPPKIDEKFQHPQNAGQIKSANAVGIGASLVCGSFIRVFLRIETGTKEILEAKFKSDGCGFAIAAAETLTAKIVGKKLNELHGSSREIWQTAIETELEKFPDGRRHCLELCLEAVESAFAAFRASQIDEFTGEKALICACFGVSEETIENAVKINSLETVEEVTDVCRAGGGCGSCQPLIQEILDVLHEENYAIIENY